MLTKGDDFPVHQRPEPIAYAGGDRNFYDRYFFNGYSADGTIFFACAMGFYPQLGIVDAAFSIVMDGKQTNIRASRHTGGERMDLSVGPVQIIITEPLKQLQIIIAPNDSGITANLTFTARHTPIEEPRFTRRNGTRLFMDYTRMTQNGCWHGTMNVQGQSITLTPKEIWGTRDRSWGIRPVGAPEPQPPPDGNLGQFFWIWAPCNFAAFTVFAHSNDDANGLPWNRRAVIAPINGPDRETGNVEIDIIYHRGSRRISSAKMILGSDAILTLKPSGMHFYMHGLGYTHAIWGHGTNHGPDAVTFDVIDHDKINDLSPENMHIQALSHATLEMDDMRYEGTGILEQLLVGPHRPSGFMAAFDGAQ